jgi:peptidoglycan/LPS O-acetylase OafA/YrhL
MKQRILELDGIRGIAILLVLVGHYCSFVLPGVELFAVASLGVNVFFVLSGFLIGGIIVDEHERRGFLGSFYRRRAARILPIYFTVVAAAFVADAATAGQPWADRLLAPWVYLLFLTNFALAELGKTGLLLNPTWSLAVEEQFYLAMPFLVMLTPRRLLPLVLAALCVVALVLRWLWISDIAAIEVLLVCRMDSLLIGVGAALLHRRAKLAPQAQALLATALAPLALVLVLNVVAREVSGVIAPTAFATTTALLMLAAINGAAVGDALRAPWLLFFGEISYGLYLIHEPFRILLTGALLGKTVFQPGLDRIPVSLLALALAVAAATVSWRRFERPIIQWARREPAS